VFHLGISDELALVVETAREFATGEIAPHLRQFESARSVGEAARKAFGQIGLAGLELPEICGGAALGTLARVLVNEELAAADPGAALALDPAGPALYPLQELAGEAEAARWADVLLAREGARATLVWAPDASLQESDRRLSGQVPWVPTDRVDSLVLLDTSSARVVNEGIRVSELRGAGLRSAGAAELHLDEAPIEARWEDPAGAERALARTRLYTASLLLGVLRHACEFSRNYALERVAFGRPIAHHQGLAFLITDMQMALDGARLLVHEAAWRLDEARPDAAGVAASAYAETIEAANFVGPNGVQILGGHGFMQDYPMEKVMREARALGLFWGGLDAAREAAGRALSAATEPIELSPREGV